MKAISILSTKLFIIFLSPTQRLMGIMLLLCLDSDRSVNLQTSFGENPLG